MESKKYSYSCVYKFIFCPQISLLQVIENKNEDANTESGWIFWIIMTANWTGQVNNAKGQLISE